MHNNNKVYKIFHILLTHLKSTKRLQNSCKTCFDLQVLISQRHIVVTPIAGIVTATKFCDLS